jgi:DHA2 family multidrug resistance protein-like MFS transporter
VIAPLAGALSDRIHAGLLGGVGMGLAAVGMALLAYMPDGVSQWNISWRMALCGIGYGLFMAPNARLVIAAAPLARAASAGALIATNRLVAQALGAALLAGLLAQGFVSDNTPALFGAALAALAAACSAVRLGMATGAGEEADQL